MKLYEAAMEHIESWESFTQESVSMITITRSDTKIVSTTQATQKIKETEDELLHHVQTSSTSTANGESTVSITERGYQNGIAYYASGDVEDLYEQHFQAPLSKEDYQQHYETVAKQGAFECKFTDADCKTKSSEKLEEGWAATYTDFTEEYVKASLASMQELKLLLGGKFAVCDFCITLTTDKKFLPTHINVVFVFEAIDKGTDLPLPEVSMDIRYTNPNQTDIQPIDLTDYREVQDIRVLDLMNIWINNFANDQSGKFISSYHDLDSRSDMSLNDQYALKQAYSFSRENGAFEYAATINEMEFITNAVYKNGVQSYVITNQGTPISEGSLELSQSDAEQMIYAMLFPTNFGTQNKISDIKVEQKGYTLYTFTVEDPIEKYQVLQKYDGRIKNFSCTAEYTLSIRKDDLEYWSYSFLATYEVGNVQYHHEIAYGVTFYSPSTYRTPWLTIPEIPA